MKFVMRLVFTVFCCSVATRQEVSLTCDLQTFKQKLDCGHNVIVILSVAASHRESESCVNGVRLDRQDPPLCSMTAVLQRIQSKCNGQYSCSVPMDYCHSAKPCSTRCVWMETTYTCSLGKIRHVCQKQKASLYCGSQVIKVLMANFGRTSQKVCWYKAPRSQAASTSCKYADSLKVMSKRCDGRSRCSVRASVLVFSNPCPGTKKYLQYSYTCVDAVL